MSKFTSTVQDAMVSFVLGLSLFVVLPTVLALAIAPESASNVAIVGTIGYVMFGILTVVGHALERSDVPREP